MMRLLLQLPCIVACAHFHIYFQVRGIRVRWLSLLFSVTASMKELLADSSDLFIVNQHAEDHTKKSKNDCNDNHWVVLLILSICVDCHSPNHAHSCSSGDRGPARRSFWYCHPASGCLGFWWKFPWNRFALIFSFGKDWCMGYASCWARPRNWFCPLSFDDIRCLFFTLPRNGCPSGVSCIGCWPIPVRVIISIDVLAWQLLLLR